MRIYRQFNNVEKPLLHHILNDIESKYMKHLSNEDKRLLEYVLPSILQYLFTSYGKYH